MRTFLIDYDLPAPGKNYTKLVEYIRGYDNYCHYLRSGGLVHTASTAAAVRDGIRAASTPTTQCASWM